MFRLRHSDNPNSILITIEGELKGESVRIADSACQAALSRNVRVIILIKNVTEIDADGHAFLRHMAATKAQMRAIGIYSRYVIKNAKRSHAAQPA